MEALVDEAQRLWGVGAHCVCSAFDGMEIDLGPAAVTLAAVPPRR